MNTNEKEMVEATKEVLAAYAAGEIPKWDRVEDALCDIPNHFSEKEKGTANQVTWLAELVFNCMTSKRLLDRADLLQQIRAICANI